jgi:hypothetical protein
MVVNGNKRRWRAISGLTLIEVLASGLVISILFAGLTAAWRIMDYQFFITRLQDRISRVVRQANDWTLYCPYDALPSDRAQILPGYLYEPFDQHTNTFRQELPYSFSASVTVNNPGTSTETTQIQLTLNYLLPAPIGHETQARQIQLQPTTRSRM